MNRKFSTILAVLLILALSTSTVGAAGAIKLSGSVGASWPLHLDGTLTGLGGYTQGVTVTLAGFGDILSVACTSPGGKEAPGQNPGKMSVSGSQDIGSTDITKTTPTWSRYGSIESNGVPGLKQIPGFIPRARIASSVAATSAHAST